MQLKKKGKSVNTLMESVVSNQGRALAVVSESMGDAKEDPSSSCGDKRCGRHNAWRPEADVIVPGGAA